MKTLTSYNHTVYAGYPGCISQAVVQPCLRWYSLW